jgi:hypothetical protein
MRKETKKRKKSLKKVENILENGLDWMLFYLP